MHNVCMSIRIYLFIYPFLFQRIYRSKYYERMTVGWMIHELMDRYTYLKPYQLASPVPYKFLLSFFRFSHTLYWQAHRRTHRTCNASYLKKIKKG